MTKKVSCFLRAGAMIAAVVGSGSSAIAQDKLVFASYLTEVYSASRTDNWFLNELEKRSGGEIKFERYWAGALLKAPDLYPALRSGAADIVESAPSSYNVREYPLSNILLPLTSSRGDAVAKAWTRLYASNADFRKEYESKGAKVLYAQAWAENTLWSRKPVAKAEDLKGMKIRAIPPVSEALSKLGATPVALTWPDGLEGLQRGVVDGMSSSPFDSGVHGNAMDVAKYGTDAGGMGIFAMAITSMGMDRYKKLSEKHRKLVDEVAAEAQTKGIEFLNQSVDDAVDKLCTKKEGLTIHFFPPAEVEKVRQTAVAHLQDAWIKRAETEAKVNGRAMLDEFLSYVHEYEKSSTYLSGFERFMKKCGKKD
jgi:TRAP-type C4-dicarboxylate transport system substrate-binding protein